MDCDPMLMDDWPEDAPAPQIRLWAGAADGTADEWSEDWTAPQLARRLMELES